MLLGGHHSVRVLIPIFIIFSSLVSIVYQWRELVSGPYKHILRLHDYLAPIISTPSSTPDPEGSPDPNVYRELYSVSTPDKKYFFIDFLDQRTINPNIIPHPVLRNTWVVTAQRHDPDYFGLHPMIFEELTCSAVFQHGVLQCLSSPAWLPIVTEPGAGMCKDAFFILNLNKGPHDARVFYGPQAAYVVYGANSNFTCFGQTVSNFGSVVQWGYATFTEEGGFDAPTEIQRPGAYGAVEKNFFMFWDTEGKVYAHYDVSPARSFAELRPDGTVGMDLAERSRSRDEVCMKRYMPAVGKERESIHQATNSLAVTLCRREDPGCVPDTNNTFIMHIFQHKRYRFFHSVYEPYAILFRQEAPFEVYAIARKPYWIHGRWKPNDIRAAGKQNAELGGMAGVTERNETEMMYVTSMSWKRAGQKYHGFVDDVVFLAFGIEDNWSAGIDVVVGDLLMDLGVC